MRKIILFTVLMTPVSLAAQEIAIQDETKRINGTTLSGYSSTIKGDFNDILNEWTKNINEYQLRRRRNYMEMNEMSFPEVTPNTFKVFTTVNRVDSSAIIWIGFAEDISDEDNSERLQDALFNFLYKFSFDYNKQKIQKDIEEAERAATFTSRKHNRLIQEQKNLELKLTDARNEKRRLEATLEELQLEVQVLMQKIEDNQLEQTKVYQDLEQIKKVLEKHKERLKEID